MQKYDLIVIGSGPGGSDAALHAARHGLKTALIEKQNIGGTCLNRGCIPSKSLLASARILSRVLRADGFGINASQVGWDWAQIQMRQRAVVEKIRKSLEQQIAKSGISLYRGTAKLTESHTVKIQGDSEDTLSAKFILIAAGAEPAALPGLPIDEQLILSSTGIFQLPARPRSIAIIGGGPIGVEFASFFEPLGTEVHIIEMLPALLPLEDYECGRRLESLFTRRDIQVHTGQKVLEAACSSSGVRLKLSGGQEIQVEKVLSAVGRSRLTANLGLDTIGVQTGTAGTIKVNAFAETNVPGVYAIGDVLDSPQLAHAASYEGMAAVEHMLGRARELNYGAIPSCVYSEPEVMSIGWVPRREEDAGKYQSAKVLFAGIAKAQVEDETDGFMKLYIHNDGTLAGASGIGSHVTELSGELAVALQARLKISDLAWTIHAHPTLSEIVPLAARQFSL